MLKGLENWFPVFKSGKHKDSNGKERNWTIQDLDTIIQKYDPEFSEAPIVVGHPKDNTPAFGWVESLRRDGEYLFAKCKQVVPEFSEAVKSGLYKKRSISLNPDLTLKHIGFLGAMPPAVKGLTDISFFEEENLTVIEFMDYSTNSNFIAIASILQSLRDFLIEKYDIETADKIVNNWQIEDLSRIIENPTPEAVRAFCEKFKEEIELAVINNQNNNSGSQFSADNEALKTENLRLKAENDKLQADNRKKEFSSFCEELIKEGRLIPAQKTYTLDFMEIMHNVGNYEFSEDGNKSALDKYKDYLKKQPAQINFSEIASNGSNVSNAGNPKEIATKARAYQFEQSKIGNDISIDQAVSIITSQNS